MKITSFVVGLAVLLSATSAMAFTGQKYVHQAKVTLVEARATALKVRPGTITDQELERERGGSGLRYSFDVKADNHTFEVGVDAKTGKVLENKTEGPNAD